MSATASVNPPDLKWGLEPTWTVLCRGRSETAPQKETRPEGRVEPLAGPAQGVGRRNQACIGV